MSIGYDNRPNLSTERFEQRTGDTLNLCGYTNITGVCGKINSDNGYSVSGSTILAARGTTNPTSLQIGLNANSGGNVSTAIGWGAQSIGNCSLSIGWNNIVCAPNSTIIGGQNTLVCSGNTGSVFIGLNTCTIPADTYVCTVVVPSLAMLTSPSGSGGYLCYNPTTKKIEQTIGGGILTANNGLNVSGNNVRLGGALTGNTTISGNYTLNICSGANLNTQYGYQISGITMFDISRKVKTNINIGCLAGNSTGTGINNTAIGYGALYSNTTGCNNFGVGSTALFSNTTGKENIGIGCHALYYNCSGCDNIGFGNRVLHANTVGCNNIVIGSYAFTSNDTGSNNVVIGGCAFFQNTGSNNVVIGLCAGFAQTNASDKLFIANCGACTLISGDFVGKTVTIDNKLITTNLQITNGATNGYVLTSDASGNATWQAGGGGGTASGENITKQITQASHGFAVNDVIGWSGGTYNKAIADGSYDGEVVGIVSKYIDTSNFDLTQAGYVTGLTSLVANTTYFLSDVTAGLLTSTEPTAVNHISKSVLVANSTTSGWVLPYAGYIITSGGTGSGGTTISGTTGYLAKFNATSDNVEDSYILDAGTTEINILKDCISLGKSTSLTTCLRAHSHATSTVDMIISPGTNLTDNCTGSLHLDAGKQPVPTIYLGSPTFTGTQVRLLTEGTATNIQLQLCSKGTGILGLFSNGGIQLGKPSAWACFDGICLRPISFNDICIYGAENNNIGATANSAYIRGGDAINTGGIGGNLILRAGNGTATTGRTYICSLPTKTSETCVLYIDSNNRLSTGVPSGGGGDAFGWSDLALGSTVAGCGTKSGATLCSNTYYGVSAGTKTTTGTGNVGIGSCALNANTNTNYNTAVGINALKVNTSGQNTAVGALALQANIGGYDNTGIGQGTINGSGSGYQNSALGSFALAVNTSGFNNVALGNETLRYNTTGENNIASGYRALYFNCGAGGNIAFGYNALYSNTGSTAECNVAIGYTTLYCNRTGKLNIGIGCGALRSNLTGDWNIGIGNNALYCNTSGVWNIGIGDNALSCNKIGNTNVAIGAYVLQKSTVDNNIGIGYSVLAANTGGTDNIGIGYQALIANTSGNNNIAHGRCALGFNLIGCDNVAIGYRALLTSTSGVNNVAIGYSALGASTTGTNNIAIGCNTSFQNRGGSFNIAMGPESSYSASGSSQNISLGFQSLNRNLLGTKNIAIGCQTLYYECGGSNVAIGERAGMNNHTGTGNVFLGKQAGYNEAGSNKLHIANCDICTLIYGEFDNKILCMDAVVHTGGYTCAGVPAAGSNIGGMVYITDCNWMVWSNGTNWLHFSGGTAI